jgi:hypothetical protein
LRASFDPSRDVNRMGGYSNKTLGLQTAEKSYLDSSTMREACTLTDRSPAAQRPVAAPDGAPVVSASAPKPSVSRSSASSLSVRPPCRAPPLWPTLFDRLSFVDRGAARIKPQEVSDLEIEQQRPEVELKLGKRLELNLEQRFELNIRDVELDVRKVKLNFGQGLEDAAQVEVG